MKASMANRRLAATPASKDDRALPKRKRSVLLRIRSRRALGGRRRDALRRARKTQAASRPRPAPLQLPLRRGEGACAIGVELVFFSSDRSSSPLRQLLERIVGGVIGDAAVGGDILHGRRSAAVKRGEHLLQMGAHLARFHAAHACVAAEEDDGDAVARSTAREADARPRRPSMSSVTRTPNARAARKCPASWMNTRKQIASTAQMIISKVSIVVPVSGSSRRARAPSQRGNVCAPRRTRRSPKSLRLILEHYREAPGAPGCPTITTTWLPAEQPRRAPQETGGHPTTSESAETRRGSRRTPSEPERNAPGHVKATFGNRRESAVPLLESGEAAAFRAHGSRQAQAANLRTRITRTWGNGIGMCLSTGRPGKNAEKNLPDRPDTIRRRQAPRKGRLHGRTRAHGNAQIRVPDDHLDSCGGASPPLHRAWGRKTAFASGTATSR